MSQPLTWLCLSLGTYLVASHLVWLRHQFPDRWPTWGRWIDRAEAPWSAWVLHASYYGGIPLAVLAARLPGLLPAFWGFGRPGAWLGSAGGGWTDALRTAGIVGGASLVLLVLVHGWFLRSTGHPGSLWGPRLDRTSTGRILFQATLLELHWAFFRATALSLGSVNPTASVYLALGLLAMEAWMNPAKRTALEDVGDALRASRTAALSIVSATVYLATQSSWLALGVHALLALAAASLQDPIEKSHAPAGMPVRPSDGIEPTIV